MSGVFPGKQANNNKNNFKLYHFKDKSIILNQDINLFLTQKVGINHGFSVYSIIKLFKKLFKIVYLISGKTPKI